MTTMIKTGDPPLELDGPSRSTTRSSRGIEKPSWEATRRARGAGRHSPHRPRFSSERSAHSGTLALPGPLGNRGPSQAQYTMSSAYRRA